MYVINWTDEFRTWYKSLKDSTAKKLIRKRLWKAQQGHFGDQHELRDGISEMRVHFGPGYRIYYCQTGKTVYLLLMGADKTSKTEQEREIDQAIRIRKMETGK